MFIYMYIKYIFSHSWQHNLCTTYAALLNALRKWNLYFGKVHLFFCDIFAVVLSQSTKPENLASKPPPTQEKHEYFTRSSSFSNSPAF